MIQCVYLPMAILLALRLCNTELLDAVGIVCTWFGGDFSPLNSQLTCDSHMKNKVPNENRKVTRKSIIKAFQ